MATPYHVNRGDTLSAIARQHGMTWQALYNHPDNADFHRNHPNPNLIKPGDVVMIPEPPQPPANYTVPDMNLIPQDQSNACWYASARMVVEWKRSTERMTRPDLLAPGEEPILAAIHKANNGLQWAQMRTFAQQLGLRPLPLGTPTPKTLENWLRTYGPIWTDGVPVNAAGVVVGHGHVVVLAGIRPASVPSENYELLIYDPWPPGIHGGNVRWRPGSHLAIIESGVATNPDRNVSFLALP